MSSMGDLFKKLKRPFNGTWDAVEADMVAFQFILLKLSVRNILKFKSISKLWYSVLSTKYFIIMQRLWSKRNPKYFVYYDAGDLEDEVVRDMWQMEPNGDYTESYFLPEFETIHNPHLISSFNGLICCLNYAIPCISVFEIDIRICNPATREVLLLPRSHSSAFQPIYGVIYANKFHFYKIFKFFSDPMDIQDGGGNWECEVYSSNTGSWKLLGKVQIKPMDGPLRPLVPNHVCVNEKLYWFIADKKEEDSPGSILMVDMNEKFHELHLPMAADVSFLIEFQGQVCFVDWNGMNISIWSYDENNDKWTLLGKPMFPHDLLKVEYFDSVVAVEQDILFVYKDISGFRHEIIYDVQNKTWDYFYIDEDNKDITLTIFPFIETLLPCNPSILLP